MMNLKIQIISLLFSFLFGIFFSLFLKLNNKIIFSKYKIIRLFGSFLIILVSVLIYFICLQKINNSIFHPYLLLMIVIGFLFENALINLIVKKIKK